MKFKSSIKFLAPICATLLIAGCGGQPVPEKPDSDVPVNPNKPDTDKPVEPEGEYFIKEPTTIVLKSTVGQQSRPILDRFVESFKKVEPNVTVKLEYPGGGYAGIAKTTIDEFQTDLHGDMVIMYPDAIADCIDYGYAYDLNPYIDNAEYGLGTDKSDYIQEYLAEGQNYVVDGTYSLPFSKSTECMFYAYDKIIGQTFPGANNDNQITKEYMNTLTWEKFFGEFCPAVVAYSDSHSDFINKTDKDLGWGILGYDSDSNLFITLAQQYGLPYTHVDKTLGEGYIDFYNKEGTETRMLDKMVEFAGYAKKNYIFTKGSRSDKHTNELLKFDKCLITVGSTAGVGYQWDKDNPREIVCSPIPQAEGRDAKVLLQGPSMAFLGHKLKDGSWDENRKLASWLFYKHMTTTVNAASWAIDAHYSPIRESVFKLPGWKNLVEANKGNTLKALSARANKLIADIPTEQYFTSPAFKGSNESRQQVEALVKEVFLSDGSQAAVKKIFDEKYNKILAAL